MQTFKSVFHFNNQAFGGFFTNTRQFHQCPHFFTLNGINELLR
ncbi:Uncharacterised protein [Klebsiella variicola]|nr:Uncharacterised protein [Klebsiella variicola]